MRGDLLRCRDLRVDLVFDVLDVLARPLVDDGCRFHPLSSSVVAEDDELLLLELEELEVELDDEVSRGISVSEKFKDT